MTIGFYQVIDAAAGDDEVMPAIGFVFTDADGAIHDGEAVDLLAFGIQQVYGATGIATEIRSLQANEQVLLAIIFQVKRGVAEFPVVVGQCG